MLLEAEADVDDEWIKNSEYQNGSIAGYDVSSTRVLKKLTNDEVIAQCFVFLLAGFDTTANSLAYVSYCLAMDTRVQQKLQSEIDEICIDEVLYVVLLNSLSLIRPLLELV
jgi:cytochrome P450